MILENNINERYKHYIMSVRQTKKNIDKDNNSMSLSDKVSFDTMYHQCILHKYVDIEMSQISKDIDNLLLKTFKRIYEGVCVKEGYIQPDSIKIVKYTSGKCNASKIRFGVTFTCQICTPIEGMKMRVVVKNITKAGIRAKSRNTLSPLDIFIARDHHVRNEIFQNAKVNDEILVVIIGNRYELYDKTICVIADIAQNQENKTRKKLKIVYDAKK